MNETTHRSRWSAWQAVVLVFFLPWAVSCKRNAKDSEEVGALRAEVKSLREELKSVRAELEQKKTDDAAKAASLRAAAAQATNSPPPEFAEFMRMSRRIVSAMGTGVSYQDFGQRLVEVNASAEEVLPKVANNTTKAKVADFVTALHDAHVLWGYKISSDNYRLPLQKIQSQFAPANFAKELGDRWNYSFPVLVKKYELRDEKNLETAITDYGNYPEMLFDRAIKCIFVYATRTFRELEKPQ